ncbi:SWIM zinc finger family protein [Candidatus Bipolaricaulota bacterium]|nr:SWIM zinc finger family protein [Candidatus Bipolaricaulota bacterium]
MGYWRNFEYTTPKPVEDGIKARTRRGKFGESRIGKRWIEVLESFGKSNRLERGRRYARKGQVREVNISSGQVTAEVQGSRSDPYRVRIDLEPYPERIWREITDELSSVPLYYAAFSSGSVPEDFHDVLSHYDLSLAPKNQGELNTYCSCPDSANPCKHIAAVYYLLGETFDEDPFQLIKIRGRSREELLEALSGNEQTQETEVSSSPPPETPLDTDPDKFWKPGPELPSTDALDLNQQTRGEPAILKLLGVPQFLPNSKKYRRSLREAFQLAQDMTTSRSVE